ncbi:hypothetical protein Shal_3568 [Shewanella halifaxensis HAW-EB4]|uniref:Transmembrane protein n=1 Tax=Shewanella halifaxensis (strain HAW-EB4) TaxID=458817 RepID=B0TTZ8_SHEHH|nr:hypothetical protein [Shewanella halifaxensis]ABZ78109.1 hypothetical protein Shal_3568 [Shewanella halifaxensis HAW-EB4]
MDFSKCSSLAPVRYSYLAAAVIYLLSWIWLPAATLWIALLGWAGFRWRNVNTPHLKQAYWVLLQSIWLYLGLHLAAFASFWGASRFNRGGLFSTTGAEEFGYLLGLGFLGALLLIIGTLWPLIRLVKSYRALMAINEACNGKSSEDCSVDSSEKSHVNSNKVNNSEAV